MNSLKSKLLSTLVAIVAIVISLLLAEGVARLVVDKADFLNVVPVFDERLGHRLEPGAGGHDELGFRNREVPKQANIVAIGDSMTYGSGAPRDGAWPQQLAALSGDSVYNMGLGGYGPLQYLHLASTQAKTFKPRQLLVSFYFGNDLVDAYMAPQNLAHWKSWGQGAAASAPAAATAAASAPAKPQRRGAAARDWLTRHSVIYGLLRTTVLVPFAAAEQKKLADQMTADERMSWTDPAAPAVKTVFTAQQRLVVQDQQPSIREGLAITKRAFAAIQEEADKQGIPLLVVLIPTRERIYCPYLKATGATLPPAHVKLCDQEEANKAELVQSFQAKGIAYVDPTAAMEAQVKQHVQIYPPTSDGHPTSLGHKVIAEVVLAGLKRPAAAAAPAAASAAR